MQEINRFLRGWAGFFRDGNSTRHFEKIRNYALTRLSLVSPSGTTAAALRPVGGVLPVPEQLGLIGLNELVVFPDPSGPGGNTECRR